MFSEKRKGDISEVQVCYLLLEQGYEVFRNISCVGFADIVAIHTETKEKLLIDVKTPTVYTTKDGTTKFRTNKLSDSQVELDMKVACAYEGKLYIQDGKKGIERLIKHEQDDNKRVS